ncbi:MAG: APC family permease [Nanoarchaeota archaeon]|nr:APC family permease [Nanoarchaeota archaeon]
MERIDAKLAARINRKSGKIVSEEEEKLSLFHRLGHKLVGYPKNVHDSSIFHKISLIALLSWIGLGADGLSSSSYGPEEAFKAIAGHTYLAILLAVATAMTVFIISYSYSRIIEHFPHGGGGYMVATHTLGKKAGVLSGSALLVDYVLTITVSLAACGDALFSFLPLEFHPYKLLFKVFLVLFLIMLNLRGVKESIMTLTPIFAIFVITHILLLGYGLFSHIGNIGPVMSNFNSGLSNDIATLGIIGVLAIFLRAFSLGGGTYTGIEAVSNGLQVMREPKVQTGKRTMMYMAVSLAITAGGLFLLYLLFNVSPVEGKTLNAVLASAVFGNWGWGHWVALITILSEGALLFVGAQTGFTGGPSVMSNMAVDSWLPKRFASLSERFTMQNGVALMGISALILMLYTNGSIAALVVMYAINVFLTFSLSQLGMSKFFISNRKKRADWKRHLPIHLLGLVLCMTILIVTVYEKFWEGGWLTLVVTSVVILLCYIVHKHYEYVRQALHKFDEILHHIHTSGPISHQPVMPKRPTAVLLVNEYNGFGVKTLMSIIRNFPGLYKNIIFVSVAEIDSGVFKGVDKIDELKDHVRNSLEEYVKLARSFGIPADYRIGVGTDVVDAASQLCYSIAKEFRRATFFAGKPVFEHEYIFHKLLHNETAFAIQRRLQWSGLPTVVLPIKVEK